MGQENNSNTQIISIKLKNMHQIYKTIFNKVWWCLGMYLFLNKNRILARFTVEESFGIEGVRIIEQDKNYDCIMTKELESFIANRKAPKHREHITKLLKVCGCETLKGYLDVSHALSLTDTFWVKSEKSSLCWEDVSLYRHPFNTTIAKIAFDGGMFGQRFSSTSPEFGTDGAFAKCWIRENREIKLIKCGSEGYANSGLEPYSEYYASQVLRAFGVNHVEYNLSMRHGKLVSKCKLFTSEEIGLVPFYYMNCKSMLDIVDWHKEHGVIEKLAEMIVADALILNQDRHLGNFGCLLDNNTGNIVGIAPLYDHNISLLCYATDKEIATDQELNKYIQRVNLGPKLYNEFINVARQMINPGIRRRLINMQDFKLMKHPRYNLSDYRIDSLNRIINNQIKSLLKTR